MATHTTIGDRLIAKAKEIKPTYTSDGRNDVDEALEIVLSAVSKPLVLPEIEINDDGEIFRTQYYNLITKDNFKNCIVPCIYDGIKYYCTILDFVQTGSNDIKYIDFIVASDDHLQIKFINIMIDTTGDLYTKDKTLIDLD